MNPPVAAGTCGGCDAHLAAGQRYCIECGEPRVQRQATAAWRPPERSPAAGGTVAGRRSFGAVGTVVLACGVLMGAAVGPALTPSSFASAAGQVLIVATAPAALGASAAGSAQPAGSGGRLAAPTGNVVAAHKVVQAGGGSVSSAPSAPAPAAPQALPAPSAPARPTTPPADPASVADPSVAGVVVHLSHGGHGYAIATKGGQLIALHSKRAPALGDLLKTTVKPLPNGTFRELKPTLGKQADSAKFHGTVTFADAAARTYTVSARGVSLLVHLPPPPPDPVPPAVAPPPPAVPAVGTLTAVDAGFRAQPAPAPARVEEIARKDGDPASGDIDLEAIVRDPGPDPTELIVSADDAGESAGTLSLTIPPDLDASSLIAGTVIAAAVSRAPDGTLTLVSAAEDSGRPSTRRSSRR